MLTPQEQQRKQELLTKYQTTLYLTPAEAEELRTLIQKDKGLDEATKLLLSFALGALIGYAISGGQPRE